MVDIAHDTFDRAKGVINMRGVIHGQYNAGDNHDHQGKTGKNTEIPHVIEVFRNGIVVFFVIQHRKDWKTMINPSYDRI